MNEEVRTDREKFVEEVLDLYLEQQEEEQEETELEEQEQE